MNFEFTKTTWFERLWPVLVGAVSATIYAAFLRSAPLPETARDLLPAALNIGAITVGFLATAKSILFSLNDTARLRALKVHGAYDNMVGYLLFSVHWSFVLTIVSAVGLLINPKAGYVWIYVTAWLFASLTAMGSFYQVVRTFTSLLRSKDA